MVSIRAPIPKEPLFPSQIEEWHRVAAAELSTDADTLGSVVRQRGLCLVAGGTGNTVVGGESGVVKQLLSQRDALFNQRSK